MRVRAWLPTMLLLYALVDPRGASAQNIRGGEQVPRLEQGSCPFEARAWAQAVRLECRYLVVPQHRDRVGATIRLPVAILRAQQQATKPPVVILHGGPGLSALGPMLPGIAQSGISQDRDVVLYDQRGAGLSTPALCPEFRVPPVTDYSDAGRGAMRDQLRACVQSLRAKGVDLAAYSTAASADDLYDLRRALRYEMWDVFGESYGGRLAQEAIRRDSAGIRAVVLSSPTIVGPGRAEAAATFEHAFTRVSESCKANSACNAAFPTFVDDFHALFSEFEQAPLAFTADTTTGSATITLDGEQVGELVRRMLRAPSNIAFLPLILHEMRSGDRLRAARELFRRGARARVLSATFFLVECNDQYGPTFESVLAAVTRTTPATFRQRMDLECDVWQTSFAPDGSREPVRSSIPTLIVTGQFDPVAPPEWGRRIAATLSRAVVIEVPGESHEQPSRCRTRIVAQFLSDPYGRLDDSCVARMPPVAFASRWPS